ncbi:hypothetical protein WJX72_007895 [[Myrmecia] bisecta]|uniref:Flavodoxin-like domain-containing protein n=1 Tax=[Myrmecia] bisecta TaxID=41462 RepID=A0AAW1Q2K1_9CHLO
MAATIAARPLPGSLQHCRRTSFRGRQRSQLVVRPSIPSRRSRRGPGPCFAEIGLFFSTSTGHTEEVASFIQEELGTAEPQEIGEVELSSLEEYDGLVVGAPTWNTGADEARSGTAWDDVLANIAGLNLKGKPVAVYGLGDAIGYGDYFCDAMEEVYRNFEEAGAKMIGHWPADDYEHSDSKALLSDGTFCGLPLDQDNEDDKTEGRIKAWAAQLKKEGIAA